MKPIRALLVGVGNRGRWAVRQVDKLSTWEAAAIVDTDPDHARAAQQQLGLRDEQIFSSLDAALERVEADAAIICTPTPFHAPMAKKAFAADLAVLVEKGMTTDLSSAVALVDAANRNRTPFCVVQNHRYFPAPRALSLALGGGRTGRVGYVELSHQLYRPEPRTLTYPFAMVWDWSVHHFDTLIFLLGEPRAIRCKTFSVPWSQYPHDAGLSAQITFAGGVLVNYSLSLMAQKSSFHFSLHTTEGVLEAPYTDGNVTFTRAGGVEQAILPTEPAAPADESVLRVFEAYLRGGREPGISGRHNLQTMALCQAACLAATTRHETDVPALLAKTAERVLGEC